jgi:poly-gamma-glutamate synthesis protein (capsule biosynthesis protein)
VTTCTLFLCGDVMTGRGLDQIFAHPSPADLAEPDVSSALEYVGLAERAHGPIPRRVGDSYVWGDALAELDRRQPVARIINLETSVTTSADPEPKGINYRMHPANIGVLSAARITCAVLANNHVLDWGTAGLKETIDTLETADIRIVGAGRTSEEAEAPTIIELGDDARLALYAFGAADSGVPETWAAGRATPGVNWIGDFGPRTTARICDAIARSTRENDIVVVSIHWGANWGYAVPDEHRRFAHALIDVGGVHLVYGHSSHHVKPIEVYQGRAVLYGCGDFLNDYEGIPSPRQYRDDLTLMYFPTLDVKSGDLVELAMVPLLVRQFRLSRPGASDAEWLCDTLDRECRQFGAHVEARDGYLALQWR